MYYTDHVYLTDLPAYSTFRSMLDNSDTYQLYSPDLFEENLADISSVLLFSGDYNSVASNQKVQAQQ